MNTPEAPRPSRQAFEPVADMQQAEGTAVHNSVRTYAYDDGAVSRSFRLISLLSMKVVNGRLVVRHDVVRQPPIGMRRTRPMQRRGAQL